MEMIVYGLRIEVSPDVYEPAEDTFLLAANLTVEERSDVLEIGTGTGLLALFCAAKARRVIAVDVSREAAVCAKLNAKRNDLKNVDVIRGDLFGALADGALFDLIAFNPPYLPEDGEAASAAWSGGPDGRAVIQRFLQQVRQHLKKEGRLAMIGSSLSDYEATLSTLKASGFEAKVLAKKRFFFEELTIIEAVPSPTLPSSRPSRDLSL